MQRVACNTAPRFRGNSLFFTSSTHVFAELTSSSQRAGLKTKTILVIGAPKRFIHELYQRTRVTFTASATRYIDAAQHFSHENVTEFTFLAAIIFIPKFVCCPGVVRGLLLNRSALRILSTLHARHCHLLVANFHIQAASFLRAIFKDMAIAGCQHFAARVDFRPLLQ